MASKSLPFFRPDFQHAIQGLPACNQRELSDYWELGTLVGEIQQRLGELCDLMLDRVIKKRTTSPEKAVLLTYKHVCAHRTITLVIALDVDDDPYDGMDKEEVL